MFTSKHRYLAIWFPHLSTDWFQLQQPHLADQPFVLSESDHGRKIVSDMNAAAQAEGIYRGMPVADAKALLIKLKVQDQRANLIPQLLHKLAIWSIRFSPFVSIDGNDGLLLNVSGCSHLWGGDAAYLDAIFSRFTERGYQIRLAMADSIGAAWALSRFGPQQAVAKPGAHREALMPLPPEALRLEAATSERLHKLGLHRLEDFMGMARPALRRRFGQHILLRLDQALGLIEEIIEPVLPPEPYQERLPCLEPILTRTGIDIALKQLLEAVCDRLQREQKGLRVALFRSYRIDGEEIELRIETHRPSYHADHLFKLFELKLHTIEPDLGIELFTLQALRIEPHSPVQESIWEQAGGLQDLRVAELIDRIAGKIGAQKIVRYLPDEHYWPERSYRPSSSVAEQPATQWNLDRPRPIHLLQHPLPIQVTAPIPDYPPMLFRHKDQLHKIVKADGPERIEAEWWLETGEHRDYYAVEDEAGKRYWIFRLGHYNAEQQPGWFIHGYFA